MLRYRRRQRRLAMIYVTYRAYIDMRLRPLKLFLRHGGSSLELRYHLAWPSRVAPDSPNS
jgi:hypothetical protein